MHQNLFIPDENRFYGFGFWGCCRHTHQKKKKNLKKEINLAINRKCKFVCLLNSISFPVFFSSQEELCVITGEFWLYSCKVWSIKAIKVCQCRVNVQSQANALKVSIWASPSCRNPNSSPLFVFLRLTETSPN